MEFLQYDIRVAVLITVFYMFYRLLLSRDSLHELNRWVLLGTAAASFILPLCVITRHVSVTVTAQPIGQSAPIGNATVTATSTPWWEIALPIIFWTGVIITLLYTIISISKVCILISRCEKHRQLDGTVIAVSDGEVSPFSWMHYIVMSRSDYAHPDQAILMHEREHIRRHHSWDVVFVDILTSLQWFNPAIWMLRSDLRAIHEYEADAAVLSSGVDARQYQYLLVRKAMAPAGYSVANGITHSTLKQRITMMNTHKQNRYSWLKALYILPVVALSLVATAKTVTDYKIVEPQKPAATSVKATAQQAEKQSNNIAAVESLQTKTDTTVQEAADTVKTEDKVLVTAEQMPEFKGGRSALMQFLTSTVRYPKIAQEWGVQGRIIVSFVVNADGSLSDPQIIRSLTNKAEQVKATVDTYGKQKSEEDKTDAEKAIAEGEAALEQEALRVVKAMPAWEPGKQKGKAVRVKYTMPLSFRLQ